MIPVSEILKAKRRIAPYLLRTPLIKSDYLSDLVKGQVWLKLECQQITNSFKIRGIYNKALMLSQEELAAGLIVASSGNHAIGASYFGQEMNLPVDVFVPVTTPEAKVAKMRKYGANVNLVGDNYDETVMHVKELIKGPTKQVFIDSSSDADHIAGSGTIGLEITEDNPDAELILVPVGGAGLITGVSLAAKTMLPDVQVYGLQTDACPCLSAALRDDVFYEQYPSAPSVCEALIGGLGEIGFKMAKQCIDKSLTVSEEAIKRAMLNLLKYDRVVAEASSASGAAYMAEHPEEFAGRNVVLVVSGGNVDYSLLVSEIKRTTIPGGV